MIVGNLSPSLGSLVNCSAIVMNIWKPKFHFASDRQRSQRLPTIATITIAGIESKSISAIVTILNDRQRSQQVNRKHQNSDCSDHNDRSDPSDRSYENHSTASGPAIWTIPAIIWKSIFSNCDDRSDRMFSAIATILVTVTIVNDHMETRI